MKKIRKIEKWMIWTIVAIFIFSIGIPIQSLADEEDESELEFDWEQELVPTTAKVTNKVPVLNARAAIIYDRTSKMVLYEKNSKVQKPMASTTKIMTALVTIEKANLSDMVTISKKAAGTGGSTLGIKAGDQITLHDLLYALMLRSGNDAAVAIAEHVGGSIEGFAKLMNQKAQELGLKHTHFVTPHGLDHKEHYTTAYELAVLTDYALKNETFAKIVQSKNYTITINQTSRALNNTNELLGNLQGVDGVKTGFTNGAGRCLVTSTTRNGKQIITVVLGADTKKDRTKDSIGLIEYAFNNFEYIDLEYKIQQQFQKWRQVNEKRIEVERSVGLEVEAQLGKVKNKIVPIEKSKIGDIRISIEVPRNFMAPLVANQEIGKLVVYLEGKELETILITNKKQIEKKGIKEYIVEMLQVYHRSWS